LGAGLAGVAFIIPTNDYLKWTLAILWLLAFSSATHDISIDGFYLLGLDDGLQSFFVGIRNTAYRIAIIAGQGGLLIVVGILEKHIDTARSWSIGFLTAGGIMLMLALYHSHVLPHPDSDVNVNKSSGDIIVGFFNTFASFFKKPHIVSALLFIMFYRFSEAQLTKITPLFLIDSTAEGGLGLTTDKIGLAQGTLGVIGLLAGGIFGGASISRHGLKRCLWPMVLAISIPDLVYVYLSYFPTSDMFLISSCLFIEQLGYGFGFTAYTLFLMYFAKGAQQTSHYAICTGIMALGMMLPGMISGWMQQLMGYKFFFLWIMLCCSVTFIVSAIIHFEPDFGKKK
jgi:MFS transporter, PAT family, beta-lactamase induction signal transducer AmpG